jgi:hypothetical protein
VGMVVNPPSVSTDKAPGGFNTAMLRAGFITRKLAHTTR